ncbi:MAG: enoyl-CoA hydratase/isomerase family protein [Alphaproteobacteria bacterium]|nr:enoyl-CoA hydratase/isomerase family protein [Alphaproteobacteria bacterium]
MSDPAAAPPEEIRFERNGRLGLVIPDRPRALNALTTGMCASFLDQLAQWRDDPEIAAVVVLSRHERAFCAGGDVVMLARSAKAGTGDWRTFFETEFRLNTAIREFEKPYVALIDGITMGGGVGISVHGRFRVASERTRLAMPETGIGYFPDVGGTYVLSRLPGGTGIWLGLTGASIDGADCAALGLASHYVPHAAMEALLAALARLDAPDASAIETCLAAGATDPGAGSLSAVRERIDHFFGKDSLAAILAGLAGSDDPWARDQLALLRTKSPRSLGVTFEALRRARGLSFRETMRMELRVASHLATAPDFHEGVRALLIDKDKTPRWSPSTLDGLTGEAVAAAFGPWGEDLSFAG